MKNFKTPEGMIARWISIVDMYDFEIEHRRGSLHQNADGLSRILIKRKCSNDSCPDYNLPNADLGSEKLNPEVKANIEEFPEKESLHSDLGIFPIEAVYTSEISNWVDNWGPDQLRQWQDEDNNTGKFKTFKTTLESRPNRQTCSTFSHDVRFFCQMWEEFEIKNDGILCKMSEKDPQGNIIFQIVIPCIIREKKLESLHNTSISGHLGRDKTYEVIKRKFYWPDMANDVKLWCQSCDFVLVGSQVLGLEDLPSSPLTYNLQGLWIELQ
jgi:hypothetical protein